MTSGRHRERASPSFPKSQNRKRASQTASPSLLPSGIMHGNP
jgi:hypothetical protein